MICYRRALLPSYFTIAYFKPAMGSIAPSIDAVYKYAILDTKRQTKNAALQPTDCARIPLTEADLAVTDQFCYYKHR